MPARTASKMMPTVPMRWASGARVVSDGSVADGPATGATDAAGAVGAEERNSSASVRVRIETS